jgi:LmbE family N-acetylglucosaminyl deacetylase
MRSAPAFALPLVLLWWLAGPPADAQVRPIYDRGAAGLVQALQRLQTTASALHTGAHPDDEDSAFIARVARGDHARVAYLSLNRGEGGQNIIGPELFDALGVIRTEELLQARRLDGGDQFFTRAFDFGFSKTLEETAARWHEPDVLADMVRVIRTFRPLVVYSRFTGTTADGHGHHQFAGYLTPLAVAAAADPDAFPDQIAEGLHPWQAFKFYRGIGFRADPSAATLALATGVLDPVIGRTYAAIAAEGRSLHRSQQMGALELHGPLATGLRLIESRVPAPSEEASVFAGIDTTLPGIAVLAGLPPGTLRTELLAVESAARSALDLYRPLEPRRVVPPLVAGLRATRAARTALAQAPLPAQPRAEADFLLALKEAEFSDALARAAGVVVDPLADAETVMQGGTIGVTIRTFVDDRAPVRVTAARLEAPAGWTIRPAAAAAASPATRETPAHAMRLEVTTPSDATPTQPYFLERPRPGDMYAWSPDAPNGLPFAPSLLQAHVVLDIGGAEIAVVRPVQYRFADGVLGEQRRDVHVVPALTVGLDSPLVIVPTGPAPRPHRVVVRVENQSSAGADGTLRLHAPSGWQVDPAEAPFSLDARGEQAAAVFTVTAPAGRTPGRMDLRAEATVPGRTFTHDMRTIAYPHIQTHRTYHPAAADVQVFDLEVAPVRVGYVMGSGDQVPDALRRMGVDVTLIDADHWRSATSRVRHDRRGHPGVRDATRLRRQPRPPADVRPRRRHAHRAVPADRLSRPRAATLPRAVSRQYPRHRRDGPGPHPGTGAPGVHVPEPDHERRLRRLGAGTEPLCVRAVRRSLRAAARVGRSGRGAAARGAAVRAPRPRALCLHVVRVVPAAPGRRPRRVPAVRESDQPGTWSAVTERGW